MIMRPSYLAPFALAAISFTRAQTTHTVTVGGPGGLVQYSPNQLNASIGDTVTFIFQQKNHTVTQTSLQNPCTPLPGGFDTGFQPVAADNTNGPFPSASLTIKDMNPIWIACQQTNHCAMGMVLGINPKDKFDQFLAAAKATGGSASSSSSSASSSSTTSADSGAATSSAATPPASTSAPTSGSPTNHLILVGNNGTLTYSPSNITASPGDTVTMRFMAKNHTVTQSTFAAPCRKISATTPGTEGFDSGFMPVAANSTDFPEFTFTVNDTKPLWAYCRQTNPVSHCGQGMVFAVNANESSPNTFEAFVALAKELNGTSTNNSSSGGSSGNGTSGSDTKNAATSSIIIPAGLINIFAVLLLGLSL